MRAVSRSLALAAALALLGGCSSSGKAQNAAQCPATGVLDRAGSLTKFRPEGGRDLTDVAWEAQITDLSASCRIDRQGNGVVDLRLGLRVVRGPAGTGEEVPVTYFVAVVGPDEEVLSREAFQVDFRIPGDRNGATTTEELALRIPRPEQAPLSDYRIYAALQLTAEELEYNRRSPGR